MKWTSSSVKGFLSSGVILIWSNVSCMFKVQAMTFESLFLQQLAKSQTMNMYIGE